MKPTKKSPSTPQIPLETLLTNSRYLRVGRFWQVRGRRMTTATLSKLLGITAQRKAASA